VVKKNAIAKHLIKLTFTIKEQLRERRERDARIDRRRKRFVGDKRSCRPAL
jgi:hypothetical protein